MLFYTTCYCGQAYDDVYELFKVMKHDLMVEQYNKDPNMILAENLPITTEIVQISLNPIFETLGIKNDCCKKAFLGVAEFAQLLK
jgi:DNA-directed RNA polymerase subunit N (RpoN/RPB10)